VAPSGVTRHPTDAWVAQQLREATPFGTAPRYLIRDNDRTFGPAFARVARTSGIDVGRTAYRAPKMNALCERFLGRVRRECLDQLLILGDAHLRRARREYSQYFNEARPHQGLQQRTPMPSEPTHVIQGPGTIRAVPIRGGVHHDYQRAA